MNTITGPPTDDVSYEPVGESLIHKNENKFVDLEELNAFLQNTP